ncbi:MAG: hypothetical protein A4E28_01765 [Methanocella sp. PtaU1.Bin125]|nr:MAG: hypothetical protein A4E28_01765 [Methanocella sp. PtaU1.Bin125]
MTRLRNDDSGQIHTIEGIVSALVVLLALTYIIGSITFVSPQTEKTTVMKLSVKAQDIMNVLSVQDRPGNFTSPLTRDIAEWDGGAASPTQEVNAGEPSIIALNARIRSLLPGKIMYNMNVSYIDEAASAAAGRLIFNDTYIIFQGDPQENSVMASKIVVLNSYDINGSANYWSGISMTAPKTVEVKLVLWSI